MAKNQIKQQSQRKFSAEEKRTYYIGWKNSGLSVADFCKSQGISKSVLYKWSNQFKKEKSQSDFSLLTIPTKSSGVPLTQVTIQSCDSSNSVQLTLSIPEHRVVSFIKEMCHAT